MYRCRLQLGLPTLGMRRWARCGRSSGCDHFRRQDFFLGCIGGPCRSRSISYEQIRWIQENGVTHNLGFSVQTPVYQRLRRIWGASNPEAVVCSKSETLGFFGHWFNLLARWYLAPIPVLDLVEAPCFDQGDSGIAVLGESRGDNGACSTTAHDYCRRRQVRP